MEGECEGQTYTESMSVMGECLKKYPQVPSSRLLFTEFENHDFPSRENRQKKSSHLDTKLSVPNCSSRGNQRKMQRHKAAVSFTFLTVQVERVALRFSISFKSLGLLFCTLTRQHVLSIPIKFAILCFSFHCTAAAC